MSVRRTGYTARPLIAGFGDPKLEQAGPFVSFWDLYGGREIVQNTVELTTQSLLETSFFADLTGDGEFAYVTRNQIRAALAVARTEIQAIRIY